MTAAHLDGWPRVRVISCLVASVPGLDTAGARRILAAARVDRGRALHEVDALLDEHPRALASTPAAYPLALERWSQWAKRDWAVYVGERAADDSEAIESPEHTKQCWSAELSGIGGTVER